MLGAGDILLEVIGIDMAFSKPEPPTKAFDKVFKL